MRSFTVEDARYRGSPARLVVREARDHALVVAALLARDAHAPGRVARRQRRPQRVGQAAELLPHRHGVVLAERFHAVEHVPHALVRPRVDTNRTCLFRTSSVAAGEHVAELRELAAEHERSLEHASVRAPQRERRDHREREREVREEPPERAQRPEEARWSVGRWRLVMGRTGGWRTG